MASSDPATSRPRSRPSSARNVTRRGSASAVTGHSHVPTSAGEGSAARRLPRAVRARRSAGDAATWVPGWTSTRTTTPSTSAISGASVFIASTVPTRWPASTMSPTATLRSTSRAGPGERTTAAPAGRTRWSEPSTSTVTSLRPRWTRAPELAALEVHDHRRLVEVLDDHLELPARRTDQPSRSSRYATSIRWTRFRSESSSSTGSVAGSVGLWNAGAAARRGIDGSASHGRCGRARWQPGRSRPARCGAARRNPRR